MPVRKVQEIFLLTASHLALFRSMFVNWEDGAYYGAPAIDIKRPYGNGDVVSDVLEIIGFGDLCSHEDGPGECKTHNGLVGAALSLHKQMETALQIVLCSGHFTIGCYVKQDEYDSLSWTLEEK